jgi:prepilin-type N-terminal cleavage/methylation domain-containing protein
VQRGFSLVETIIATSLLAVALVTLAQLVGAAVQAGAAARSRSTAGLIAGQKMEQLRALPWLAVAGMPADTDFLDASGRERCPGVTDPCGEAVYVRRTSVAVAPFSAGVLLIEVEVRPVGNGHGGATLVTARARRMP